MHLLFIALKIILNNFLNLQNVLTDDLEIYRKSKIN